MTSPPLADALDGEPAVVAAAPADSWWARLDALLDRGSEKLNPILIKEGRQSLKSRQFVVTFFLVLFLSLGWSLLAVAIRWPGIYYAPGGRLLMSGYFCILAFPLLVITPFAAFRSLAAEREDGTYELLSITALAPRQIIGGKLGSAVVQMLVYLSALAPCLAFTYLLRGIDIPTILTCVVYVFLASVLLSALGLLAATATRNRQAQVVLAVVLIVGLLAVFFIGCSFGIGAVVQAGILPFDDPQFWIGQLAFLSFYAATTTLICFAAAARISPASENRSTRLRACMLVHQFLLAGWCAYYALTYRDVEVLAAFLMLATAFWYVMGALMTGETPFLSQRVRRRLPQSFLSRALLTWFNPGPGTGYMFAAINMISATAMAVSALVFADSLALDSRGRRDDVIWLALISCCYVIIYLGLVRLLIMLVRRAAPCGLFLGLLLHAAVLLLGVAAPLMAQWMVLGERGYTPLQVTNPFWTLVEALEGRILSYGLQGFPSLPAVPTVLLLAAALVLLANTVAAAGEVRVVREPTPERIRADDMAAGC
jgi:ABC-type transport system involved in multi-copper enzyme maturation permease subunit